ncbi:glycine betaine ABC transporter substrate-binding protein [Streptomyces sp. B-S-A8]|uniref:Glycine betaine ABC transporter substrate-binding protein n=1 Tax=Streptomyces solicavernae TaxID=3043614 RepID=A0ABT6S1R3_9ACTN|nr:glycine betaine ABC transporter substrate-binding protein [Streptomyces sp. B-S-A8]MDI3389831.1 glycine betaine ABC transporter substrate-binding protein [Streptomyces sp. B-S-A8]
MPRSTSHAPRRLAATALTLAALTTACGPGATGGPAAHQLQQGSLARDFDLKGTRFTVGSKEFTEQQILGKILLYALRAAGARTTDQTGLNGTNVVRQALKQGEVDIYWEYSGTGWTQFLQHDRPIRGAEQQFRATAREDRAENGVTWLAPARFGNQYALARAADATGPAADVHTLSDLAEFTRNHPEQATLCGASEFLDRELRSFQKTYDARFPPELTYQNALALNYVNVAKASPCRFAEVFTSDARITSLDLKVLDDDRGHFTTELAAVTVRNKTAAEHPQLKRLAQKLGHALTEKQMIELNGMVDLEGRTPDEAALAFLAEHGFIGKGAGTTA